MIEKPNELAIVPKLPLSIGDHCIVIPRWVRVRHQPIGNEPRFRSGGLNDSARFNV
jgi:hypothetical protein